MLTKEVVIQGELSAPIYNTTKCAGIGDKNEEYKITDAVNLKRMTGTCRDEYINYFMIYVQQ